MLNGKCSSLQLGGGIRLRCDAERNSAHPDRPGELGMDFRVINAAEISQYPFSFANFLAIE